MSSLTAHHTPSNSPVLAGEFTHVQPHGIDRELRLKFADFVPFLPKSVLNEDAAPGDVDITFDLVDVVGLLTSGCSRVPVAWLRQRAPHCLGGSPSADGFTTMLFPWQKVRSLLAAALHPGALSETAGQPGLTPTGGKWLASVYKQQRIEAWRERRSSEETNAAGPADNLLAVRPTTQFPPLRPTAPPVKEVARPIADRTSAAKSYPPSVELLRQRDVARNELGRFQVETERRLAAVRAELKSMIDERDDALAAVTIFSGYENDRISQLEFENKEQAKQLAEVAAELEALRSRHSAGKSSEETLEPQPMPGGLDSRPQATSFIDTGADRTAVENTRPATSPDRNYESSLRTRRRSGFSWRGWQVAALCALAALAGGMVVLGWPVLSPLIPRATALAAEVQKRISDGTFASQTKVNGDQTGGQAPAAPRSVRQFHTASR